LGALPWNVYFSPELVFLVHNSPWSFNSCIQFTIRVITLFRHKILVRRPATRGGVCNPPQPGVAATGKLPRNFQKACEKRQHVFQLLATTTSSNHFALPNIFIWLQPWFCVYPKRVITMLSSQDFSAAISWVLGMLQNHCLSTCKEKYHEYNPAHC